MTLGMTYLRRHGIIWQLYGIGKDKYLTKEVQIKQMLLRASEVILFSMS